MLFLTFSYKRLPNKMNEAIADDQVWFWKNMDIDCRALFDKFLFFYRNMLVAWSFFATKIVLSFCDFHTSSFHDIPHYLWCSV